MIAAGSLLGIASNKNDSFPVGKVDFIDVGPLSFLEFLMAEGQNSLAKCIEQQQWTLLESLSERLRDYLLKYYYVGGMPEPVQTYVDTHDYAEVRRVQNAILDTYDNDFQSTLLPLKCHAYAWCGIPYEGNSLAKIRNLFSAH